ncbi:MAG: hypothetical protein IJX77_00455 [Ruminococcus sp.]|nr:hypothetical protein [Ruminococcus sp.]
MNRIKKIAAAITSLSVAATIASCGAPTIGSGSSNALTVGDADVKAGVFIYYTMQSYSDAQSLLAEETGTTPTLEDVEEAEIEGVESSEWIQDKATQYCKDLITIDKEFQKIGGELPQEDLDEIDEMVTAALETEIFNENGIGEESLRQIAASTYKSEFIFDYYYGTDSEQGMTEDELKEYFDNNFARVKYVSMSYLDADGNKLDESGKKEIRDLAEEYAERVNAKSDDMEKLFEMDEVSTDYDEYVAEQTAAASTDTAATTTTTTATTTTNASETTTTTTTNPYANERLIQKQTTAVADTESEDPAVTTTTAEPSASEKSVEKLNNYIFDELTEYNKAVVFDDEENDAIYVVIRADLNERLTDDDLWTEDNISYLQSLNFYDTYIEYMQGLSDGYEVKRNESAYRRYEPFELTLE